MGDDIGGEGTTEGKRISEVLPGACGDVERGDMIWSGTGRRETGRGKSRWRRGQGWVIEICGDAIRKPVGGITSCSGRERVLVARFTEDVGPFAGLFPLRIMNRIDRLRLFRSRIKLNLGSHDTRAIRRLNQTGDD